MKIYGLIGYPLTHSFSPDYFKELFLRENLTDHQYRLFPLKDISEFPDLIKENKDFYGLNVTIPFKMSVIEFLDKLDESALQTNSVNTIKVNRKGNRTTLEGYNTDIKGFELSFLPLIKQKSSRVLLLGNGGSAHSVTWVLKKNNIPFTIVSRSPNKDQLSWTFISPQVIEQHLTIINCTPLGMFPDTDTFPELPYTQLTPDHLLLDMVYNPPLTRFMEMGKIQGAFVENGLEMLHIQANYSWEIWKG